MLFGPAPRFPSQCTCGRFIVENCCLCASACMNMPKYIWAKANPAAYAAEQAIEKHQLLVWREWCKQKYTYEVASYATRLEHQKELDATSPIGCYECEQNGYDSCICECRYCYSKYCDGACCDD